MSAAVSSAPTAPTTSAAPRVTRRFIKRPDDKKKDQQVKEIRAQIQLKDAEIEKLSKQLDTFKLAGPALEERLTLRLELRELVEKRGGIKKQRDLVQAQIRAIDSAMKTKIANLNLQTSKNNFKNVEEIDKKIAQLDSLVDSGSLKIVEERKTIKEMSLLRRLKKDFSQIEEQQKSIDLDKKKIADLKAELNLTQNKELNAKFDSITKRLDEINLDNDSVNRKRNEVYTKRKLAYKEKDELYSAMNKIRSDFDLEFTKFKKLMEDEKARRAEETKLYELTEKKEELTEKVEAQVKLASTPAFTEEIDSIYNLLQHFDPTFEKPSTVAPLKALASAASKEPVATLKREPESFFPGSVTKGSKKGGNKKKAAFTVDLGTISALAELGIPLPSSPDDVESTKKLLFEKLEDFKTRQTEQTKANVEKAELAKKLAEEKILKLEEQIAEQQEKIKAVNNDA